MDSLDGAREANKHNDLRSNAMDDMHVDAMGMNERARKILAAVGEPSRFRLVSALLSHPHSVSEVASVVGLSQSCTTRHLQVLQREGLLTRARHGKRVVFSLREESGMVGLIQWALAVSGAAEEQAPPAGSATGSTIDEGVPRRFEAGGGVEPAPVLGNSLPGDGTALPDRRHRETGLGTHLKNESETHRDLGAPATEGPDDPRESRQDDIEDFLL